MADKSNVISYTTLTAVGVGILCAMLRNRHMILKKLRYLVDFRNPLRHKHIEVIETADHCHRIVTTLKKHCDEYRVLGFDCEWVTIGGRRRCTALLQLASHRGLCALIRLSSLKAVPMSLRELLEDDNIVKVGIGSLDDAANLLHDYGVGVASAFDLRYLAVLAKKSPEGLAKMSKSVLNVNLDKNWRLVCSDWEAKSLTSVQIEYAAKDALTAIEIFKKMSYDLKKRHFWQRYDVYLEDILQQCDPFLEVRFKDSFIKHSSGFSELKQKSRLAIKKPLNREISTRSKSLYDNCLLEAPDGELLCTCGRKKALWYVDQNLGYEVKADPYTVRLNFEPAGRAVGEVGRYYQTTKKNRCVVCGREDLFIRKNVVPREYRKHFPVVMKSHSSHDVLLLCPQCHQISNVSDSKLRTKLAKKCNATCLKEDGGTKIVEIPELKQLRSAARALLHSSDQIPPLRKDQLEKNVLKFYPGSTKLTQEILEKSAEVDVIESVAGYVPHGLKVVQECEEKLGGLLELEKLWREHFLKTMKPKFLPELWSVNHNVNRLEIRANEGRIEKQDLLTAGLNQSTLHLTT